MQLIFVRHGETPWNVQRRFQGSTDIELSEEGIRQAQLVAKRFEKEKIDFIYSSPLKRAYATALAIKGDRDIEIHKDSRLKEINFGSWEGNSFSDAEGNCAEEFRHFKENPATTSFPGEGSLKNAMDRGWQSVEEIIEKHKNSNDRVLISAHGGIIRLILFKMFNLGPESFYDFSMDNTAVSIVEIAGDKKTMRLYNDTSHLRYESI